MLVVTVVLSITSEKVTEMDESYNTEVSESEGEVEYTVGAVVSLVVSSVVVSSVVVSSVVIPVDPDASSILLESSPSSSAVICPQEFKRIPRRIAKLIIMN